VLLLLFGMRWLRKAVLRASGVIALHDEEQAFANETAEWRDKQAQRETGLDWVAGMTCFKAVLLEGLEVVFIVIAVGAGQRALLIPAAVGAASACLLVVLAGFIIHRPLSKVPENSLKFVVGVMLSAFGMFWTGEGLGIAWPGGDLVIIAFAALFFATAFAAIALIRRSALEPVR
jgi:uncharacterized membrane protein